MVAAVPDGVYAIGTPGPAAFASRMPSIWLTPLPETNSCALLHAELLAELLGEDRLEVERGVLQVRPGHRASAYSSGEGIFIMTPRGVLGLGAGPGLTDAGRRRGAGALRLLVLAAPVGWTFTISRTGV
jgi:hypothetical protein